MVLKELSASVSTGPSLFQVRPGYLYGARVTWALINRLAVWVLNRDGTPKA